MHALIIMDKKSQSRAILPIQTALNGQFSHRYSMLYVSQWL